MQFPFFFTLAAITVALTARVATGVAAAVVAASEYIIVAAAEQNDEDYD